jgi:hypothetical protein
MQKTTMTKRKKWIGNDYAKYDPKKHRMTKTEWLTWRCQFDIGAPRSTEFYSVDDLKKKGMVGLYEKVAS